VDFERDSLKAAEQLVVTMAAEGFGLDDLATVPPGVAAPLFDALQQCGATPPEGWDARAYDLVGRHDLAMLLREDGSDDESSDHEGDGRRRRGPRRRRGVGGESSAAAAGDASDRAVGDDDDEARDDDGLRAVEAASALRFGDDCRVQEVCRLLRASRPTFFRVDRPPEMSDHDFEHKKQQKLLLHCTRLCATTAGRAMLTLASLAPLRTLAEPLPVPKLCLSGRSPPSNAVVALDASTAAADALGIWPQFHNGVAAGLRLQPCDGAGARRPDASGGEVTRTWIAYNKPEQPSAAHGGLLFALGLQRHLGALAMTDIYEYLTLGHDPTTVGVLLGMAASKRGSADSAVSKMLCLHIPALLPQPFAEMEVSAAAQAAAMTGVGLLYCGTAHRLMAEFLLGEPAASVLKGMLVARDAGRKGCCWSAGTLVGRGAGSTAFPRRRDCAQGAKRPQPR
jgi:anaphase-promoting complex subunit 1